MYIRKLKFIALSILFILSAAIQAQDLIVTADGDSINCKITKVEKQHIYFGIYKDGAVLYTLLPTTGIKNYRCAFYPVSEIPASAEVEGPKDFPRFRLAANGGWSYRLAKVSESVSADFEDYIRELKSGYSYGLDATYFWSKKAGIGFKYDVFRSKNELDGGTVSDDISVSYIGPFYSSRFLMANKKNSLLLNVGLGYVGYRNEAVFINEFELTGGTAGLLVDIGYDIGLSESFAMGFQVSFTGGTLTQYKISDGFSTETVELDEDEYEGLARINLSVGLRFIK